MRVLFQCFFICGYLLAANTYNVASSESATHPFDVLIFTQHWPITVCIAWKELEPDHTCILPSLQNIWTVHGIWPTKLGTIGPAFCNNTWPFDPKQLSAIEPQLEQYWGNVHSGSRYALWEHEWAKHGTCAAQLPALNSEVDYFGQGLKWISQYNMDSVLQKAGILPGSEHDALQLSNAVHSVLGKDAGIECLTDRKTGIVYLFEIRICFDKELELTDCDGIKTIMNETSVITNCPPGKPMVYPGKVPQKRQDPMPDVDPPAPKMRWLLDVLYAIKLIQWLTL